MPKCTISSWKKIMQHLHYVYIIEQNQKSSDDKPINTILNNKLSIVQNIHHAVKTEVFKNKC